MKHRFASHVNRRRYYEILVVVCCAVSVMSAAAWALDGEIGWLITPDEAAMAPAPPHEGLGKGLMNVGREDLDIGPIIEVVKPSDGAQTASPLEVAIRFTPRLSPIDMDSLKIGIVKFVTIDITDRVKPYATPQGIQLKEAKIPSGKHRVRISLSDAAGSVSIKEVMLEVL